MIIKAPAAVDLLLMEVEGDGFGGDVAAGIVGEEGGIEAKMAGVGAKEEGATWREEAEGLGEELGVVSLEVEESLHLFGAGEGGGIDDDEIISVVGTFKKFEAIGADDAVLIEIEVIEEEVLFSPLGIGVGHVDTRCGGGACQSGVDAEGAGVGKEIEKVFA